MLKKVLLVDDHAGLREQIRIVLEDDDELVIVGEADNGLEALRSVAELAPDLVVMDARMPVMDGMESTRRIKQEWPAVIVVGFSATGARSEMLGAGATAYVDKADGDRLLDVVRAFAWPTARQHGTRDRASVAYAHALDAR